MKKLTSLCVECGLPCMKHSCPYYEVEIRVCDICGNSKANYLIDGEDVCMNCADNLIRDEFNSLTLMEKAEAMKINARKIDD